MKINWKRIELKYKGIMEFKIGLEISEWFIVKIIIFYSLLKMDEDD